MQTQLLERQGKFDSSSNHPSASPPPPAIVHKLRFPKCDDAEDPLGWLHKCEQDFRSQSTQVWTATFYLESVASQCYYHLEKNRDDTPSWPDFVEAVNKRFGPPMRTNTLGTLAHCRRTGSVEAYQDQFLKLLARCDDVSERQEMTSLTCWRKTSSSRSRHHWRRPWP